MTTTPSYTDEQVPEVVRTAPERIFLQVSDEDYCKDDRFPDDNEEVTWCDHSVTDVEVEYVRADLFAASEADRQRLQAEVEALRPDAERYRWLRDRRATVGIAAGLNCFDGPYFNREIHGTALDQAIDAARATPNETKEAKS